MSARPPKGPDAANSSGASREREFLIETKVYGGAQRVTVIEAETGREASATGPLQPGVQQSLINIAIGKLRRGLTS